MKIAYLIHWDISQESGVYKKVLSQMRQWKLAGHDIRLFAVTPSQRVWDGNTDILVEIVVSPQVRNHLFKMNVLVSKIKSWHPDLVYLRFSHYYPALESLSRSYPVVVEINSNDISELRYSLPASLYLYHRITRGRIFGRAHGLVCLTNELARSFASFKRPTAVITNGIELDHYPELPAPSNPNPRLVFIGTSKQYWHGIEKILQLADHFRDWRFDLIGIQADEANTPIPANVNFHGFLNRELYEPIFAQADIAIGTLAAHRKNMFEACSLKVREYLAYGLPTIIGYQDTDFLSPVPFLLNLPNTPDSVRDNIVEIGDFVNSWLGRRVQRSWISRIDSASKEQERLAFFCSILEDRKNWIT